MDGENRKMKKKPNWKKRGVGKKNGIRRKKFEFIKRFNPQPIVIDGRTDKTKRPTAADGPRIFAKADDQRQRTTSGANLCKSQRLAAAVGNSWRRDATLRARARWSESKFES